MLSALVDTSVIQRFNLVEGAAYTKTVGILGKPQAFTVTGYRRKRLRDGENKWLRSEIDLLPTIARLCREKKLQLYRHPDITHEVWNGSIGFRGTRGDLLSGFEIPEVESAVERSYFQQMTWSEYTAKNTLIEFSKLLLRENFRELESKAPSFWKKLPPITQKSLINIDRFKLLCAALPEKHYIDAMHLWTAEANGLSYFLTLDRKFIHALTASSRVSLPVKPLLPSKLLEILDITETDSVPVTENRFYHIFD